ncbi:MAG: hypothetical protein K0S48_35 [Ramlibacter sp.]|jgi:hypothetical protein|nr:hypothetical protein [Ramlibacter sp.]
MSETTPSRDAFLLQLEETRAAGRRHGGTVTPPPPRDPFPPGGSGSDNDRMNERVEKLEKFAEDTRDRLTRIESKLDTFVTKADLHQELHSLSWKLATLCSALTAAVYFIAKNVQ